MEIQSTINAKVNPRFTQKADLENDNEEKLASNPIKEEEEDKSKKYSGKQISAAVLATALSAAALGGAVMHGRGQKVINKVLSEKDLLQRSVNKLESTVTEKDFKIKNLTNENGKIKQAYQNATEDNNNLRKLNKELKEEVQKAKDKFQDIFEGDIAPKEVRDRIYTNYKAKIESGKLNYDIETPPVTGKKSNVEYTDAVELPKAVGTTNRANMIDLHIPQIKEDGSFDFKLPTSAEMKISHMETKDFKPVKNQMTNITESYADSVQWNNDKIARDVLQNFYDGHGQTLDGVQLTFTPTANGTYKVRIKGDSTYTVDKAVYIGESTKRDNAKAAGNYGEGLKMSVLKLLKDGGASEVNIGSDNWKLTYNLQKGDLSDKKVLAYSLDKVDKFNGNYIEFETSDKNLLETFRTSINRFYHSNNPHFKCPDFENELIGIKNLPKGQKGGIYIAGQRFEFNNDYDGLEDIAIFIKEKPPVSILDPSRDRTSLNTSQLEEISKWLEQESRMSKTDRLNFIKALEPYWEKKNYSMDTPVDNMLNRFILYQGCETGPQNTLHIKFPQKYIAYSPASPDVVMDLKKNGYVVCKDYFEKLGMPTIKDLIGDARAHDVVIPNEVQTKKILILKEAISNLSKSLKDKHFTPEELDTKIYMFDNKGAKDNKLYSSTLAEAIVDNDTTKGFWIDKGYLDSAKFSDVLETALHELSHKAGGDETAEFSYKLTNVNKDAIEQIITDAKSRNELQALNRLWDELSTQA